MRNLSEDGGAKIPLIVNGCVVNDSIAQGVLDYWEGLRDGRLVPKRSEIDPRALRKSLNHTFILEARTPDNIRFRLAGSKLCDCMGMEMRGMPAYAMIVQEGRNAFNEAIQICLAHPQIVDFQLSPTARMVLLPMADEDNTINRILGCVNADPNNPDFPTRFTVRSMTQTRIIAAKSILPKLVAELAEDQQPFQSKTKKAAFSKPPHLRIVK
jgi:hypothetical protein